MNQEKWTDSKGLWNTINWTDKCTGLQEHREEKRDGGSGTESTFKEIMAKFSNLMKNSIQEAQWTPSRKKP